MLLLKSDREAPEGEFTIRGGYGKAFRIYLGQFLTVTDVRGQQVADFFAFNAYDLREFLSPHHTRLACGRLVPPIGACLVSNRRRSMFTLVRDTVGCHDLLMPACDPALYAGYGVSVHRSCVENATEALRGIGVSVPRLYDPVNLFMNVRVHPDKGLSIEQPLSKAGDYVAWRATMDVLCVFSACPMDLHAGHRGTVSDIKVRIHNEP